MKQFIVCLCLISGFYLAASALGWPSGWPVTNAVPEAYQCDIYTTNLNLRTVVAQSLLRSPGDIRQPRPDDLLLAYARENGIPVSNVVKEARIIAEEGLAILASGRVTNEEERTSLMRYCRKLITFMSHTKDPSALPYLESKSASTNDDVRQTASRGIINILGTDSVDFLRRAARDGIHQENEFYPLYETLGHRLQSEKKMKPEKDLAYVYIFLLELAEREKAGDTAKMLDRVLCENLDDNFGLGAV